MEFSRLWHIVPWGAQGDFEGARRQLSIALTKRRKTLLFSFCPDYLQESLSGLRRLEHCLPFNRKSRPQGQSLVLLPVSVPWLPSCLFLYFLSNRGKYLPVMAEIWSPHPLKI